MNAVHKREWKRNEYTISTDDALLDLSAHPRLHR